MSGIYHGASGRGTDGIGLPPRPPALDWYGVTLIPRVLPVEGNEPDWSGVTLIPRVLPVEGNAILHMVPQDIPLWYRVTLNGLGTEVVFPTRKILD